MTTTPTLPLPKPEHRCGTDLFYKIETVSAIQDVAYQAGSVIDLAGHKFEGRNLIERVMRNMAGSNRHGRERWAIVKDTFAVGSTVAHALCCEFDLDPDDILRK